MAEGDDNMHKPSQRASNSEDSSSDVETLDLDLVNSKNDRPKRTQPDINPQSTAPHEPNVRKDDNPFSFRHFLHSADRSYHNQGARPKVYCEGRPVSVPTSSIDISGEQHMPSRLVNEYPSALPDFVQDHLVIEQCYLNKNGTYSSERSSDQNLPDFAMDGNVRNEDRVYRPQVEFPLDLPLSSDSQNTRNSPQAGAEVGNSKSLPDFLADGAVRNTAPVAENEVISSSEWEADRLRVELENVRRQLLEQTRLADCLAHELEMARNKEHEYTQNLAKALEEVEENLERNKLRASSSETNILKLRQEVKLLNKEINRLRKENMLLKSADGAMGGPSSSCLTNMVDNTAQKQVAQDLRSAASTAEQSLRQLLSGVENLRLLASRVENLSKYEEHNSYNSDEEADIDEDTGPAL